MRSGFVLIYAVSPLDNHNYPSPFQSDFGRSLSSREKDNFLYTRSLLIIVDWTGFRLKFLIRGTYIESAYPSGDMDIIVEGAAD